MLLSSNHYQPEINITTGIQARRNRVQNARTPHRGCTGAIITDSLAALRLPKPERASYEPFHAFFWGAALTNLWLIRFFRTFSHTYSQSRFLLLLLLLLSIPKGILASVPRHFFSRHLGVFGHFGQHLHNGEQ